MITLQEISGYLPYNPLFKSKDGGMYFPWPHHKDVIFKFDLFETPKELFKFKDDANWIDILNHDAKIILRPLSDLTKEIEVNGEKFVPIIELAKIAFVNSPQFVIDKKHVNIGHQYSFYYDYTVNSFNCLAGYDGKKYDYACFVPNQLQLFQKLFEWHFWLGDQDRFGNDIIDINTLK